MNDSFLEDLGLVEEKTGSAVRDAERYITTRHSQSPKLDLSADFERNIIKKQTRIDPPVMPKKTNKSSIVDVNPKGSHQTTTTKIQSDTKSKRSPKNSAALVNSSSRTTNIEKKAKIGQVKVKSVVNTDELLEDVEVIQESKKHGKRPSAPKEGSRLSDGSTKENNRPSDSSADSGRTDILKERRRISSENMNKKLEISGDNTLPMLGAIKEIVSVYTRTESNKIMRMMQDLYINSQSNLMKQLLLVTDDLKDLNSTEGSSRFQTIVNENSQLSDNVAFLRCKIEELQRSVDDMEKLKQENLMLKTRIRELEK